MGKRKGRVGPPRMRLRKKHQKNIWRIKHSKLSFNTWDKKATPQQQYELLGLTLNPNETLKSDKIRKRVLMGGIKPNIKRDRKLNDYLPARKIILTRNMIKKQTKKDVFRRLIKLKEKYGENYQRMENDVYLNKLQDTASKLKNKIKWMSGVEYKRKLLALYTFEKDYEKMAEDKVFNWRGMELEQFTKMMENFLKNELKDDDKKLLDPNIQ